MHLLPPIFLIPLFYSPSPPSSIPHLFTPLHHFTILLRVTYSLSSIYLLPRVNLLPLIYLFIPSLLSFPFTGINFPFFNQFKVHCFIHKPLTTYLVPLSYFSFFNDPSLSTEFYTFLTFNLTANTFPHPFPFLTNPSHVHTSMADTPQGSFLSPPHFLSLNFLLLPQVSLPLPL